MPTRQGNRKGIGYVFIYMVRSLHLLLVLEFP